MRIQADGIIKLSTTSTITSDNNTILSYSPNGYLYIQGGSTGLALAGSGNRNNAIYVNSSSNAIQFHLGDGTEKARITSSGSLGLGGITNPQTQLQLNGTITFSEAGYDTVRLNQIASQHSDGSSPNNFIRFLISNGSGVTSERMRINGDGNLLINTTTDSGNKLEVNGTARFGSVIVGSLGTGTVYSNGGTLTNTNPSDYRLKNTIKPLTYGLNEVMQLNPKSFYYNDNATNLKYGFIAQEVKEVMPELARKLEGNSDYLGLETEGIFVTLVNAVKELKAELDLIKNK
jgi:hypothetical protein